MKKIIVSILIISILLLSSTPIIAMRNYEEVDFVTGLVTATALNVRTGPSTNYRVIGTVYKNEFGKSRLFTEAEGDMSAKDGIVKPGDVF